LQAKRVPPTLGLRPSARSSSSAEEGSSGLTSTWIVPRPSRRQGWAT